MFNEEFAKQFIRKIHSQSDYNINIMNEHGIIIASCNEERIGTFHATAYKMIINNINVHVTDDLTEDLPGVTSPGVNLLLRRNSVPVGVIGVSGDPDTVMSLAKVIRVSFESLYDYELQKELIPMISSDPAMKRLARVLFLNHPINATLIRTVASEIGVRDNINRYPLLIEYVGNSAVFPLFEKFIREYNTQRFYSPNDLIFHIGSNLLLLFKEINENAVAVYRKQLRDYVDEIDQWFFNEAGEHTNHYFCGTVQNKFTNYAKIYEDLMWLFRYRQKKEMKIYFLADYLTEFMMSKISSEMLAPLLDIHVRIIREHMDETIFMETVAALIETNMNLGEAANLLYLHKNTVAARVKKIKDLLDISPLTNTRDAIFIMAIYNYLNNQ